MATQQKLSRHSTLTMTVDNYGTVFDKELTASSRVSALLCGNGSPHG